MSQQKWQKIGIRETDKKTTDGIKLFYNGYRGVTNIKSAV